VFTTEAELIRLLSFPIMGARCAPGSEVEKPAQTAPSDRTLTGLCTRTVRLKVRPGSASWLNAAAIEVNQVWNWANEVSAKAARPYSGSPQWLSGFDLCAGSVR
jgi:hypothetical protein